MITLNSIVLLIAAYLLGSMPFSVWVGQLFYKIDVREYGSGNAGATNTMRVLGKRAGIAVLVLDVMKGVAAVNLLRITDEYIPGTQLFVNMQLVLGIAALFGHIFPVYAGFRGGKGISTLLGVVIALDGDAAFYSCAVFLLVLITTRYVSLSSIIASIFLPIYVIFIEDVTFLSLIGFSLFITIIVVLTHQKNIERLLRREETKIFASKSQLDEDDEIDD
ncbi:MAG: glycerol-3-phosphate 1-O-acyltransferase PlsY [Vicingaceae bacterium]